MGKKTPSIIPLNLMYLLAAVSGPEHTVLSMRFSLFGVFKNPWDNLDKTQTPEPWCQMS